MNTLSNRRRRAAISVATGILAALSVAVLLWVQVARIEARSDGVRDRFEADIVEVLTATRDIEMGELLGHSNTRSEQWLSTLLPAGTVMAADAAKALGQRATSLIVSGEPVTHRRFSGTVPAKLSVPSGFAAVSIRCDSVTALGGEIIPGMCVDVLGVIGGGPVDVVVSGAQILSASNATVGEKKDGVIGDLGGVEREVTWVTLAVPAGLVKQLVTVATTGTVHLVLPGADGQSTDG